MVCFTASVSLGLLFLLHLTNATTRREDPTELLTEDFEDGQVVGQTVVGADKVRPSLPSENYAVIIIDSANNPMGTGNALRMSDNNPMGSALLAYNIVKGSSQQVSMIEAHLVFTMLGGSSNNGDYFSIALGEVDGSFSSRNGRFIDCRLVSDGTIDFYSSKGPHSRDNSLVVGRKNTLSIFANDYDAELVTYVNPNTFGTSELPPNSVAYWLNGKQVMFGEKGYTLMEDRETSKGTVFGSEHNLGSFGISSYSHDVGLDIIIDSLRISTLYKSDAPSHIPSSTPPTISDEPTPYSTKAQHTSSLVYPSEDDGRLVYAKFVNERSDIKENIVPDFSNSGYRGGGILIPFVSAIEIVQATNENDHTLLIQNAINRVSNMEENEDGFRGAVLLKAGVYRVNSTLKISSSGVVIRGEGSRNVGGTTIIYTASTKSDLFTVYSGGSSPREVSGSRTRITDIFVPVGSNIFTVTDASFYKRGDSIIIKYTLNDKWINDLSDMSQWGWEANNYQLTFRRTILEIDTSNRQVKIDAPIVQAIEAQYGGACIYKFEFGGEIKNIGFEGMKLMSTYSSNTDENHGWHAIVVRGLTDGWIRQVTGYYFGGGLVSILSSSNQMTVEDCAMLDHKSVITGGRRYSFNVDDSERILMQRCLSNEGRHDFVTGSKTPGPNVFVDCLARNAHSDIGPHHRYGTGQLYDNIKGKAINVQNRKGSGSGHGWAGAQVMIWNCQADIICDVPNGGMNWAVGNIGSKKEGQWAPEEPDGFWDSHNQPVFPRSLYYTQLKERLGLKALQLVALPRQINGANIWSDLGYWDGDGLFLDPLVVYLNNEDAPQPLIPVLVYGIVRNLWMLDNGFSSLWSKLSGPGMVSFADKTMIETTVTFGEPGSYRLQLSIANNVKNESASLFVTVSSALPSLRPSVAPTSTSLSSSTPSQIPSSAPSDVDSMMPSSGQKCVRKNSCLKREGKCVAKDACKNDSRLTCKTKWCKGNGCVCGFPKKCKKSRRCEKKEGTCVTECKETEDVKCSIKKCKGAGCVCMYSLSSLELVANYPKR